VNEFRRETEDAKRKTIGETKNPEHKMLNAKQDSIKAIRDLIPV